MVSNGAISNQFQIKSRQNQSIVDTHLRVEEVVGKDLPSYDVIGKSSPLFATYLQTETALAPLEITDKKAGKASVLTAHFSP